MVNSNFKKERIKDEAWKAEVRKMPCFFCKSRYGIMPHHIKTGSLKSLSQQPEDDKIIPVCPYCHDQINTKGENSFYKKFDLWKPFHAPHLKAEDMYKRYKKD